MTTKYIDRAEVARLMKRELTGKYPAVAFSIKSKTYSGGGSIFAITSRPASCTHTALGQKGVGAVYQHGASCQRAQKRFTSTQGMCSAIAPCHALRFKQ